MTSVVVPIRGSVIVRRVGMRCSFMARYSGARVDGLVIILSEGGGDVP